MHRNMKKLLCCVVALLALLLTACRSGGGKTTEPPQTQPQTQPQQTTAPAATLPRGEGVEDADDPTVAPPVSSTEPQENDTEPSEGATEPRQEDPTEPPTATQPPRETEPQPTQPPAATEPQIGTSDPADVTYEEYLAMSPQEQQAHYEKFPSLEAYIAWHNAALEEYEENQGSIEVTGGIDIGDFMTP